jgi:hypothetical protein
MRAWMVGFSVLMLAGCGGGESYPLPLDQVDSALAGIGSPSELDVLPQVQVSFQPSSDHTVQWSFSHNGDELGRLVATASASGDKATKVSVDYVNGTSPDSEWHNGEMREQLKTSVRELVVEAVDSKLENRSFDQALYSRVQAKVIAGTMGSVAQDVSNRFRDDPEADAKRDEQVRRLQEKAAASRACAQDRTQC